MIRLREPKQIRQAAASFKKSNVHIAKKDWDYKGNSVYPAAFRELCEFTQARWLKLGLSKVKMVLKQTMIAVTDVKQIIRNLLSGHQCL